MPITPAEYRQNVEEVSRRNSKLSKEELADKMSGIKRDEKLIREMYSSILPDSVQPDKASISSEITEYTEDNAYALGFDRWEILMPVDGTKCQSRLGVLAEEVAHNIDRYMSPSLDLEGSEERIYREFMANALADSIFDGRNQAHVERYREVNEEIEEFYDKQRIAEKVQNDIPVILDLLEPTIEQAKDVDWDLELCLEYEEALKSNISAEGLEVEKVNEASDKEMRSPTLEYEDYHIGDFRDWLSGDIRSFDNPEAVIEEIREDTNMNTEQFASKYDRLIQDMKVRAKDEAGFDRAHVVGRELWNRMKSDGAKIEHLFRFSEEEIEKLIKEKAPSITEEYGIQSEEFGEKNIQ